MSYPEIHRIIAENLIYQGPFLGLERQIVFMVSAEDWEINSMLVLVLSTASLPIHYGYVDLSESINFSALVYPSVKQESYLLHFVRVVKFNMH